MADEFRLKMPDFHVTFRDLLHAVNLRHGIKGFTSLPKEGVLSIFSLRPSLNPRSWVPKASTLPLDRRSCWLFLNNAVFVKLKNATVDIWGLGGKGFSYRPICDVMYFGKQMPRCTSFIFSVDRNSRYRYMATRSFTFVMSIVFAFTD